MNHASRLHPKSRLYRAQLVESLREELRQIAEEEFRAGIPHSAADFADRMLVRLRERWGGEERHFPAGDHASRDRAIRRMFNGRNLIEVCSKFAVSPRTVYRACNGHATAK